MSVIIFLGPSLAVSAAQEILNVEYLPPAKMGDIIRVVARKPTAIGIIDGYFEHTPAVWHKEILYALSQGIPVFGSSSMGALRAAELDVYGMQGVGNIYQDYTSGQLEDDDEVAVLHASVEDGYLNQSDALVNIRYGLRQAVDVGVIDQAHADTLLHLQKQRFYHDRRWAALLSDARDIGVDTTQIDQLSDFIEQQQPNQKRDDAISLLQHMKQWLQHPQPHKANFTLESTVFWEQALHQCTEFISAQQQRCDQQSILEHFRITHPGINPSIVQALQLMLLSQEIKNKSYDCIEPAVALTRFRQDRGLYSPQDLKRWMQEHVLEQEEVLELAQLEAMHQRIIQLNAFKFERYLQLTLKNQGLFRDMQQQAAYKQVAATELGLGRSNSEDQTMLEQALSWYQSEYGNLKGSLAQHAAACGFGAEENFIESLCTLFLTHRSKRQSMRVGEQVA